MNNPAETLKFPAGAPGDALKGLASLLSNAKGLMPAVQAPQPVQIGPELAYKLAQAVSQASDRQKLEDGVIGLIRALADIDMALAGSNGS